MSNSTIKAIVMTEGMCPRCGNWHMLKDGRMPQHQSRQYAPYPRLGKCYGSGQTPEITRLRTIGAIPPAKGE